MIINIFKYILKLAAIIAVQILIISNIQISTLVNPFIYIVFILTLPFSVKPWQVLIISFLTGFIMDSFTNTPGMHMAATTFMGYLRGFYLKFSTLKEDLESSKIPGISEKGMVWFAVYVFFLTLAHHTVLFFLEIWGFKEIFYTFYRIILSSLMTLLLIIIGQLFFYKPESNK